MNDEQARDLAAMKILMAVLVTEICGNQRDRQGSIDALERIRSRAIQAADRANIEIDPPQSPESFRGHMKRTINELLSVITVG